MEKKKVLIGLSWPYANGRMHIGHVASSLPADVLARFHRSIGNDVSFVSGSDCFGTPIMVTALSEGSTPEAVAQKYHDFFVKDFGALGFTFDNFTKTMDKKHLDFVQQFHKEMYKGDYIFEKTAPQLYCEKCERFLPDRYVEGICPHCKKPAKGDSCDSCGKILEPEELISPRCKLCSATPVSRDATQLYVKLSALQDSLQKFFDDRKEKWPANAQGMTQRYLNEGLHDRAITRSIDWGIPVPMEGWDDKRIYLWAENVLGYLSASSADFIDEKLKGEKLHYYVHAKDNIPFHALILPGLILAHGNGEAKYHLPDIIVSSEYITVDGEKISKSKGNLITAEEMLNTFDSEMIRYYFLRSVSDKRDSNFTIEDFVNVVNGELVNNFGNLVNRTLSFVKTKFGNSSLTMDVEDDMRDELTNAVNEVVHSLWNGKVNKALLRAMEVVNMGNKHFDEGKPWITIKTDLQACKKTIGEVIAIIAIAVKLLEPFIPNACEKVTRWIESETIPEIEILFKRLDMKEVKEKFRSGK